MNKPELTTLFIDTKEFVQDKLSEDFNAADVAHAISYIATDMGLHFTNNGTRAFLPILDGMIKAMNSRMDDEDSDALSLDESESEDTPDTSGLSQDSKWLVPIFIGIANAAVMHIETHGAKDLTVESTETLEPSETSEGDRPVLTIVH